MKIKNCLYGITMSMILCCSAPVMVSADTLDVAVSETGSEITDTVTADADTTVVEGQEIANNIIGATMKKKMDFSFYPKTDSSLYRNDRVITSGKLPSNAENITVVSSNPKVVAVKQVNKESNGKCTFSVQLNGSGKAKISLKAEINGKKKTIQTSTVKVHKYSNPVKQLTIGEKDYASLMTEMPQAKDQSVAAGDYKLTCKPAKGWKIKKIHYGVAATSDSATSYTMKKIKNGGTITVVDGQSIEVFVELYNPSRNITQTVNVTLN